jgi:hypothetical protein
VLWLALAAPALTTALFALTPGRMTGGFAQLTSVRVINPLGIGAVGGVIRVLSPIGGFSCLLAAFLAGAALVARFRSRRGDERQQIKWLAFAGTAFLAEFALTLVGAATLGKSPAGDTWGNTMYTVMFATLALGIPAACAVAILKYRLYGIDVVISKTVVYAVLAAFITAIYVLMVVGAGALAGSGGRPSLGLSILATVVVAVAFQPVRERVQRFANRLVYGKRATPMRRCRSCRSGWPALTPLWTWSPRWPRSSRRRPARPEPTCGCGTAMSSALSLAAPRTLGPGQPSRSRAGSSRRAAAPIAVSRSCTTLSCSGRCRSPRTRGCLHSGRGQAGRQPRRTGRAGAAQRRAHRAAHRQAGRTPNIT